MELIFRKPFSLNKEITNHHVIGIGDVRMVEREAISRAYTGYIRDCFVVPPRNDIGLQ